MALATLFLFLLLDTESSSPWAPRGSLLMGGALELVTPRWVATVLLLLSTGGLAASSWVKGWLGLRCDDMTQIRAEAVVICDDFQ